MEDGLSGMKIGVQTGKPDRVTSGLADFEQAADTYLEAAPVTLRRGVGAARIVVLVLATAALAFAGTAGAADSGSVSREEAIVRLRNTRDSVDQTLALIKAGQAERGARRPRRTATCRTSSWSRSRCASPTTRSRSTPRRSSPRSAS